MNENQEPLLDPMDKYSFPIWTGRTPQGLGVLLVFAVRALPEKPGRSLFILGDLRYPPIVGFEPKYFYGNTLWQKGNSAGNHYHETKNEIFTALSGAFEVNLQDVDNPEKMETITLSAPKEGDTEIQHLYFPTRIAHKVTALHNQSILYVSASSPNSDGDEYRFEVET